MSKREATVEDVQDLFGPDSNFDVDEFFRRKQLRSDRPWTFDIIRVLWNRPDGLDNQTLYRELRSIRQPVGLANQRKFEETICGFLNRHTRDSPVWNGNPQDDLFFKPRGRGTWAVRRREAAAWLEAHGKALP